MYEWMDGLRVYARAVQSDRDYMRMHSYGYGRWCACVCMNFLIVCVSHIEQKVIFNCYKCSLVAEIAEAPGICLTRNTVATLQFCSMPPFHTINNFSTSTDWLRRTHTSKWNPLIEQWNTTLFFHSVFGKMCPSKIFAIQ